MRTAVFPISTGRGNGYKETSKNDKGDSYMKLSHIIRETSPLKQVELPEILFITSYPPRECGIATYSQDLRNAIYEKFGNSASLQICALESTPSNYHYPEEVKYILQTQKEEQYIALAHKINDDKNIAMIFLQHEFGLFGGNYGDYLLKLMYILKKPVTITFHTVLPNPNEELKETAILLSNYATNIVVMTKNAAAILKNDYGIAEDKITVIPHGTHLVSPRKVEKHGVHLADRIVLTTFGLLNQGKSIETAIEALPQIIAHFPNVIYLVIGKTHPEVMKNEGEKYRDSLYDKVQQLQLQNNVRFVNKYLSLEELMDYLGRTDIYLFTSKDPNQAVSGTFAYAMACGCPVISTPIPHAKEMLEGAGKNFDFQNSDELARTTIELLSNPELLEEMSLNALHKIYPTSWQNSAIAHMEVAKKDLTKKKAILKYELPRLSLDHIKRLTTENGMIQFSSIATPDTNSGYTLDDNARALVAMTKHYELTRDSNDLALIKIYLNFINFCHQEEGSFFNYVDYKGNYLPENEIENLEDSNGRAIWALGQFISGKSFLPKELIEKATSILEKALPVIEKFESPRAISFAIKGLHFYNLDKKKASITNLITLLADNLVSKYRGVSGDDWKWYEDYLTYANSLLPEAMLLASISTGSDLFRQTAKNTFDFLLSVTFKNDRIKVVSNRGWYFKGVPAHNFGEQPIDVAYTILALNTFYQTFGDEEYRTKMEIAFDWFLGKNHLNQIVYNPKTGGCHDGVEETHINLNQGAESTLSYLMARLVFEERLNSKITSAIL
ncbi:MAG: glycosyltransferase [Flavobacterium sp.]|uniref:glycosyltransferase n=1 Tax=Flavobacterium sp. TaxID=239 RepID=UPI0032674652